MKAVMHRVGTWLGAAFAAAYLTVVALAGQAAAAEPLVDAAWAKANAGKAGVVFVDVRGQADFLRGHIPGAVNTNYGKDGWRVTRDGVPGMLPEDTGALAELIGGLGIDNDTHVVLVAAGQSASDMGTATRLYWTFKVLGDDNVSVLDGGMAAYLADKDNALEKGQPEIAAKTFKVALRADMLPDRDEVKRAMDAGVTLVDNRPADQYLGVNYHPKAKATGTIPTAINLPENWMTRNDGGTFRSKEELGKLFAAAKVPTDGDQISFCNTGHWASVGWFAASEILGNKKARLYDGSMTDWTNADLPTEAKISVE